MQQPSQAPSSEVNHKREKKNIPNSATFFCSFLLRIWIRFASFSRCAKHNGFVISISHFKSRSPFGIGGRSDRLLPRHAPSWRRQGKKYDLGLHQHALPWKLESITGEHCCPCRECTVQVHTTIVLSLLNGYVLTSS